MVVLVAVVAQSSMSYCLRCLRCLQSSVFTDVFSLHSCLLANFCCPLSSPSSVVIAISAQSSRNVIHQPLSYCVVYFAVSASPFYSARAAAFFPAACHAPPVSLFSILHSPFPLPPCSPVVACTFFPPAASSPTFPWPFSPRPQFLHLLSHSRPKRHRPRSHTSPRRKACRPLFLFRIWRLPAWTGSIFSCSRVRLRCSTFIGGRSGSLRHHRSHHTQTQKNTHAGARIP